MSDLNTFESMFRRALRDSFSYEHINLETVLVITDLPPEEKNKFLVDVRRFLIPVLGDHYELRSIGQNDFNSWSELKKQIYEIEPSLIISYRLLRVKDVAINKSLGLYIDTLSQDTDFPILVLPHPRRYDMEKTIGKPGSVVVATEHLYADNKLVNYGLRFTREDEKLYLVHIEDKDTFEYYLQAIGKIPEIDTEMARELLEKQLLAGPSQYVESVRTVLAKERPGVKVDCVNKMGHLIQEFGQLISQQRVDLLVLNTKDDTQMAMHSLGYSLAVEFNDVPILLI